MYNRKIYTRQSYILLLTLVQLSNSLFSRSRTEYEANLLSEVNYICFYYAETSLFSRNI